MKFSKSDFQKFLERTRAGGGLSEQSISVWNVLLEAQRQNGTTGNFLELGVWHGIGLSAMGIHATADEKLFALDIYLQREIVRENFEALTPHKFNSIHVVENSSVAVRKIGVLSKDSGTFRFVHIDGEHSFDAVCNDIELAISLVREDGIIAVDDFFNLESACVTHALFYMLERHPHQLRMFLGGGNKAYMAAPKYYDKYRSICRDVLPKYAADQFGLNLVVARNGHGLEIDYLTFFEATPDVKAMKIGEYLSQVPADL